MNQAAAIVTFVSVMACLVLVSRSSALRRLAPGRMIMFAIAWVVIIAGLAAVIQAIGLRGS